MRTIIKQEVRHKKGFTLMELLVVIAIIALLMSILMPALNRAKDLAKNVVCKSNLRQCGLYIKIYAMSNEDFIPSANPYWLSAIVPYLTGFEEGKYEYCPLRKETHKYPAVYGMNILSFDFWPAPSFWPKFSNVHRPRETIMLGDAWDWREAMILGVGNPTWPVQPTHKLTSVGVPWRNGSFPAHRHPKETANILFVDSGVKGLKEEQVCPAGNTSMWVYYYDRSYFVP